MVREGALKALLELRAVKDFSRLLELPPSERLQLVEAIWDSLVDVPDAVPIDDELRDELDRRLAAYHADPSTARPWADIRGELLDPK
jgi:putative addiction module component (TIGR02574 family)